jgi:hypothetical protein
MNRMNRNTLARSLAVLAALAVPASGPALAQDERDLHARDLFVAGQYSQALEIYTHLYTSTHHPTYLRNIGRCHQMLRHPEPAIFNFRAYLRDARDLTREERAEIEGYITAMQAARTTQAAPATPPATFVAPASLAGERRGPDVTPITRKWWFWTGLGALVSSGVVIALVLSGRNNRLPCPAETICPP